MSDGDKMLDVSLTLDKTPTMMRSRDNTPTKSLRFREPRKIQSDLATESKKSANEKSASSTEKPADDSDNDSFFSLGSQMDVDSPARARELVDSPLVTRSLSPETRSKIDNTLKQAEERLKNVVDDEEDAPAVSAQRSGLLGSKDVFVHLEEQSEDSDVSMRGKVRNMASDWSILPLYLILIG